MPPPEEPVGSTGPIEATVPEPGKPVGDLMVVGIGASAGGLKALLEFFSHTIEQSGMAFVVVVHLSPEHESRLPELLQQATRMPVPIRCCACTTASWSQPVRRDSRVGA
jgi:chemotaxis response regulator CheB